MRRAGAGLLPLQSRRQFRHRQRHHGHAQGREVRHDPRAADAGLPRAHAEGHKALRPARIPCLQYTDQRILPDARADSLQGSGAAAPGDRRKNRVHQPLRRRGHPIPAGGYRQRHRGHRRGRAQGLRGGARARGHGRRRDLYRAGPLHARPKRRAHHHGDSREAHLQGVHRRGCLRLQLDAPGDVRRVPPRHRAGQGECSGGSRL